MKKTKIVAMMLTLISLASCGSNEVKDDETLTDAEAKSKIVEAFFNYTFSKQGYSVAVAEGGIVTSSTLASASSFSTSDYKDIFSRDNSNITISIGGSTSVEKISNAQISEFGSFFSSLNGVAPKFNEDRKGSGTAVSGLLDKTYDVGYLSRELSSSELTSLVSLGDHKGAFCIDAVAPIVHVDNALSNVTANELARIYANKEKYAGTSPFVDESGKELDSITSWSQLEDSKLTSNITVYSREDTSGTRECFTEKIGIKDAKKDEYMVSYTKVSSNGNMISAVAQDKNAIGYASYDSVKNSTEVKVLAFEGVTPSISTIEDGTFALQRNFNIVATW